MMTGRVEGLSQLAGRDKDYCYNLFFLLFGSQLAEENVFCVSVCMCEIREDTHVLCAAARRGYNLHNDTVSV